MDESGVATNRVWRYGWADRGQYVPALVRHGRWERPTLPGSLTLGGLTACLAVEGATDAAVMRAFVEHALFPTLKPGQVVVLDNLSVHRDAAVRRLIERAGCTLLFLPPYAPDLNRIERAWSELETLLRGVGARTTEALDAALTLLVDAITADDRRGYFRHCGYAC